MWGLMFLAGNGISKEFGIAFCFGAALAATIVACVIDADYSPRIASLGFILFLILATSNWSRYAARDPSNLHHYVGAVLGLITVFPLVYWAVGDDREKRGNPRRWTLSMMFQRKPDRSRPAS